jgi:hypothetical protein
MTCAIFGPGLVGSFLGAAAQAPLVISRQQHLERWVELPHGRVHWQPQRQASSSTSLPLLITTRFHHTPWADLPGEALAAQNGLGQPRPVAVCFLALDQGKDGVIRCLSAPRVIVAQPLVHIWGAVFAAWRTAGISVDLVADSAPAQWEKTILNATVGPLCLATGLSMTAVWDQPELRALVLAATSEGERIAHDQQITIVPGLSARAADFFARIAGHRPSVVADPGELPQVLGFLCRHAHQPIPALTQIAHLVARRAQP